MVLYLDAQFFEEGSDLVMYDGLRHRTHARQRIPCQKRREGGLGEGGVNRLYIRKDRTGQG